MTLSRIWHSTKAIRSVTANAPTPAASTSASPAAPTPTQ